VSIVRLDRVRHRAEYARSSHAAEAGRALDRRDELGRQQRAVQVAQEGDLLGRQPRGKQAVVAAPDDDRVVRSVRCLVVHSLEARRPHS